MHISKKGIRALGIAESYSGREQSVICAVAMRKDLRIDGVRFGKVTVGGVDATDSVISLVQGFARSDLNLILIGGCVISWFNIINPEKVKEKTGLPVICVTYEDSEGLLEDISYHFPGDEKRLKMYRDLGERTPVLLKTGKTLYIRAWGIPAGDAARICDEFTYDGKVPEPVRVARLTARGIMRDMCGSK
jgi:endonuclease V-like protein UPF0215 family